jgi:hypothetical protein
LIPTVDTVRPIFDSQTASPITPDYAWLRLITPRPIPPTTDSNPAKNLFIKQYYKINNQKSNPS